MTRAVIIDDSEGARANLLDDLKSYCPEIEVVGQADGVLSGAKLLRKKDPDLVFLDIHMGDGDGFDLLEVIGEHHFAVIFTTASDAHAIRAFKFSAIDYLLKPIDPDELQEAVQKALRSDSSQRVDMLKNSLHSQSGGQEKIALHTQDKVIIVDLGSVVRCESDVNYTKFYLVDDKPILVTRTLKEFDELLSDSGFIRVHQSHLVNLRHVKEFVKADGGHLNMSDGSWVPVSTRRKAMVLGKIESLGRQS